MKLDGMETLFTDDILRRLFPLDITGRFFDALFGDADEGAFDIYLKFIGYSTSDNRLCFEFYLVERPGKCLACNLTLGMPEVFSRHPIINIRGLVKEIESTLDGRARCTDWSLGSTNQNAGNLHTIPLSISVEP